MNKELLKYLYTTSGTVDLIKKVPNSDKEFIKITKKIIVYELKYIKYLSLYKDIIKALKIGYKNAYLGYLHPAEGINRFILERYSLSILIKNATNIYKKVLKNKDWHRMVDDGYVIRYGGEALGKIKKYIDKKEIDKYTIYFAGKPVCENHLKWNDYSKEIKYLYKNLNIRPDKNIKCSFCNSKAKYFTIAMPKAGALISLAYETINRDPNFMLKLYSNLSRILHPYGFMDLERKKVFTAWARDLFMIFLEINKVLDPENFNMEGKSAYFLLKYFINEILN
ncbi:hypothetical protein MJ1_0394 [Nanobdella aerobiophila]|uniref:Uncharacterized protein n=1 Tax=Nanobdella aerobiophila TaxID=2586965 RepID=A0A915SIC8_9ARCH|nr:hypothetical protein [Nanobdella aerobiophila]BBL45557.1 hypothetical protein MJ1_0394 [Nanobdella aerobiophila]